MAEVTFNPARVTSERATYKWAWCKVGWSYAEIVLYERRSFYGLFSYWKGVWRDGANHKWVTTGYNEASKSGRQFFIDWVTLQVKKYEAYVDSWK